MPPLSADAVLRPWALGRCTVRNRLVYAPMTLRHGYADGAPTAAVARYFAARAEAGFGLVVTDGIPVNAADAIEAPGGPLPLACAGLGADGVLAPHGPRIEAWRAVVRSVQSHGALACAQLWHAGVMAAVGPRAPLSAAAICSEAGIYAVEPPDVSRLVGEFAANATAAVQAGFDAVEVLAARGYLLDSFLSPVMSPAPATAAWVTDEDRAAVAAMLPRWHSDLTAVAQRLGLPALAPEAVAALLLRTVVPCRVAAAVVAAAGGAPVLWRFSQFTDRRVVREDAKFSSPLELALVVRRLCGEGVVCLHDSAQRLDDDPFPHHDDTDRAGGCDGAQRRCLAGWAALVTADLAERPTVIGSGSVSLGTSLEPADPAPAFSRVARGEVSALCVGRAALADPGWIRAAVVDGRWRELRPFRRDLLRDPFPL